MSGQVVGSEIFLKVSGRFIPSLEKQVAGFYTIAFRFHVHALKAQFDDVVIGVELHF